MGIYDREYYRDESRGGHWFSGVAPVCRTIILINVAVFLLQRSQLFVPGTLENWFAATSEGIFHHGRIWQLLTATFLHADLSHILGNMLVLWFVGREIEEMYGSRDFLALYLSAGVLSTLAWALSDELSPAKGNAGVMLGASGAVWAVIVLFALYFPRREILFFFVIPVETWLLVVAYLTFDTILLLQSQTQGTAVQAHLAGAAFGYLYKRFDLRWSRMPWNRARRPRFRVIAPDPRETPTVTPTPRASGPTWSSEPASVTKPSPVSTAVLPEEQLDARLDEVLAKIAREGRSALTDDEHKVLQEASQRARNRRSGRL